MISPAAVLRRFSREPRRSLPPGSQDRHSQDQRVLFLWIIVEKTHYRVSCGAARMDLADQLGPRGARAVNENAGSPVSSRVGMERLIADAVGEAYERGGHKTEKTIDDPIRSAAFRSDPDSGGGREQRAAGRLPRNKRYRSGMLTKRRRPR